MAMTFRGVISKYGKRKERQFRPPSRHYADVLDRVRKYIKNYEPKIKTDWHKRHVTKEQIAEDLKVKVCLVERALQELNTEGLVSQPRHKPPHDCKRDRFGDGWEESWGADTYEIYTDENPLQTLTSLFYPAYDYYASKGSLGDFDYSWLRGLYNKEQYYIAMLKEEDIFGWCWKTKKRRRELLDKIVLKSKILCSYLIYRNPKLDKNEYTKCIGVIGDDYVASFWALFHLPLSYSDRKYLFDRVSYVPAFSLVYADLFDKPEEHKIVIQRIVYSEHLHLFCELVNSKLKINEVESKMVVDRILDLNDMDLAVGASKSECVCLRDEAKKRLPHLLVAARLMGVTK
jgi:ribosomal protein S25